MSAKVSQEAVIGSELILLVLIPFIPDSLLMLTDSYVIRAILLILVLASASLGPFVLLMTFVVVMAVFIRRNQRKFLSVQQSNILTPTEVPYPVDELPPPVATVAFEHPPFEQPRETSWDWSPDEETGTNEFYPVGETIDQKVVLPTQAPDGNGGGVMEEINQDALF